MSEARDQRRRRRAIVRLAAFAVGGIVLAGAGLVGIVSDDDRWGGVAFGAGAIGLGLASVTLAKHLLPPADAIEERHAPGSPACIECEHHPEISPRRRRLLVAASMGVVAAVTGGLVIRDTGAERSLRHTPWRRGDRLVTLDGRPIQVDDLAVGAMLTAWPAHAVGVADAQVVLLRLDPDRLASRPRLPAASAAEGYVAYSKLCTHMGCPVGLFQQDPDVLVCPCHQAVFDVFDGARPVQGPARRPLPQLPLRIGGDGSVRAAGGFSDAVGPGWWERPR